MIDHADPGGSGIIEDWFDAWLDGLPGKSPGAAPEPGTDRDPLPGGDSLAELIARASQCAELIASVWPVPEFEGRPHRLRDSSGISTFAGGASPWPGPARVGRYALAEELGRGRFGIVYRGYDSRLQRDVAVKLARPEVSRREDMARRFLREAAAAARLDHPGIVPVHDAGEADGCLFYVMPYSEGEDLACWLARAPTAVDPRLAADWIRQLAEATHYGHTRGIVHRDLKPANILLTPLSPPFTAAVATHQPRILDFGLSRSLDEDLRDTRSSIIVGTPLYMSPEQASLGRAEVGPSADIFALGAILYEVLVGEPPFAAASLPEIFDRLARCDVDPPRERRPDVDPRLEQICLKCLRLHAEDRYATARDLADDLRRFLEGQSVCARRPTALDRVRWWAGRPQRVVEVGAALFVTNLALAMSMLVLSLAPNLDPARSMARLQVSELIRSQLPGALAGIAMAWLGLQVMRGSAWALWLAAISAAIQWIVCIGILFMGLPPLAMYQGNPLAKWIIHLFLLMLFSINVGMCAVALYAKRKAGGRGARGLGR